mmetsp:Transcript_8775/g.16358  ORF Transcript_8775/g.16358 Transcript_8775/m.16358 type:complete len:253 (-) Transcript_8775:198-956(-)
MGEISPVDDLQVRFKRTNTLAIQSCTGVSFALSHKCCLCFRPVRGALSNGVLKCKIGPSSSKKQSGLKFALSVGLVGVALSSNDTFRADIVSMLSSISPFESKMFTGESGCRTTLNTDPHGGKCSTPLASNGLVIYFVIFTGVTALSVTYPCSSVSPSSDTQPRCSIHSWESSESNVWSSSTSVVNPLILCPVCLIGDQFPLKPPACISSPSCPFLPPSVSSSSQGWESQDSSSWDSAPCCCVSMYTLRVGK